MESRVKLSQPDEGVKMKYSQRQIMRKHRVKTKKLKEKKSAAKAAESKAK
jgi:hypothetical protein